MKPIVLHRHAPGLQRETPLTRPPESESNVPGLLTRREFLGGSAVLTGVLAQGSVLTLVAPSRVWAATMTVLNDREAKFLLRLTQVIFPHKQMPDAINALAVKDLDKALAADASLRSSFTADIATLDKAAGGDWLAATPEAQLAAVEASTQSTLFKKVHGTCITSLYDNELAYRHFGYEGEAFSKGGYLTRGFNDLAWLPNPPADSSPAPFL